MMQTPTLKLSPRLRAGQTMRQWIARGTLGSGQPLPSERTLGAQLGVSQTVVRHVLSELVGEGLIVELKPGRRSVRAQDDITDVGGSEIMRSTIVLLTPFDEPDRGRQEPGWVEHMTLGAMAGARLAGRDVLVTHPERIAAGGLGRFLASPPLGVVVPEAVWPMPGQELWLHRLKSAGTPVVVYGDSPDMAEFDRVLADHESGSYELTRWVIAQGRRRIVNLAAGRSADVYWYQNRLRGYERAMREAGLTPRPSAHWTSLRDALPRENAGRLPPAENFELEFHAMAGYLAPLLRGPEPVDALMVVDDGQAITAAAALRLLGYEPGRDVLLVGYDNIWAGCQERQWESAVPAATVDKCNSQIGQELVRLLMDRVEGRLPQQPQRRVVSSRLVVVE